MDTAVICGLISAASAIIVSVITAIYNNKLIVYRLEQLERKMDKHNSLIERTYELEERSVVHDEKLKSASRRLENLERMIQNIKN